MVYTIDISYFNQQLSVLNKKFSIPHAMKYECRATDDEIGRKMVALIMKYRISDVIVVISFVSKVEEIFFRG